MEALRGRGRSLAYSTIKTILNNLAEKGYLSKIPAGRANSFRPIQSKEAFAQNVVSDVIHGLYRGYRNPLLAHLADELAADPTAIEEFERLLRERKNRGIHA